MSLPMRPASPASASWDRAGISVVAFDGVHFGSYSRLFSKIVCPSGAPLWPMPISRRLTQNVS
jgi:hypothetical protein